MPRIYYCLIAVAPLALGLAGCHSPDTIAATQAAHAQADLDQGRLGDARKAIGKALAARDDIVDYWLLKAHIDLQGGDRPAGFADYEMVLQLDHGNVEALQALCQIGLTGGSAEAVERYADQLLVLTPDAPSALSAKGSVALSRHDLAAASGFAEKVLARSPQDPQALALQSRILMARGQFTQAAAMIEKTPDGPMASVTKLKLLKDVYAQARDRANYVLAVKRLAAAAPGDATAQLDQADILYQDGQAEQAEQAGAITRQVMKANPDNLQIAAAVLNLWMNAGPAALDPTRMMAQAAGLSPLMQADYAQFANEIHRPDIALAILRGADQGEPTAQNANAKAALAYALGLTGRTAQAMPQLDAILDGDHDPDQPWALLARARLLAAKHDYPDAIRDARAVVANDPGNATARLALIDILRAGGSADFSLSALREGLRAIPTSTRLATRLAAGLAAGGGRDDAAQVALDLYRNNSMDLRAAQLLRSYGLAPPAPVAAS